MEAADLPVRFLHDGIHHGFNGTHVVNDHNTGTPVDFLQKGLQFLFGGFCVDFQVHIIAEAILVTGQRVGNGTQGCGGAAAMHGIQYHGSGGSGLRLIRQAMPGPGFQGPVAPDHIIIEPLPVSQKLCQLCSAVFQFQQVPANGSAEIIDPHMEGLICFALFPGEGIHTSL